MHRKNILLASATSVVSKNNYMTILALEDGLQAKLSGNTISYSLDEGNTWTSLASNTYTPTVNGGETIMFKGNLTPNLSKGIGRFTISKKCNLEGNCMSLLFGDDAANNNSLSGKDYAFYNLFSGCTTIIQVSNTFLPATTLARYCYYSMFRYCTSLTTAPELAATTLASYCYDSMFRYCSNLNYIKMLTTDISAISCTYNWVNGVSSMGTFVKNPAMTSLSTGTNGIPNGWIVVDDGHLFTFTIDGIEYQAEAIMTWDEWVDSEYNIDGYLNYNGIITNSSVSRNVVTSSGISVFSNNVINQYTYESVIYSPGSGGAN